MPLVGGGARDLRSSGPVVKPKLPDERNSRLRALAMTPTPGGVLGGANPGRIDDAHFMRVRGGRAATDEASLRSTTAMSPRRETEMGTL